MFTNQALITYDSRTQLKGTVTITGQTYTAYIADGVNNDADFTNALDWLGRLRNTISMRIVRLIYDRAGRPCHRCGTPILEESQRLVRDRAS